MNSVNRDFVQGDYTVNNYFFVTSASVPELAQLPGRFRNAYSHTPSPSTSRLNPYSGPLTAPLYNLDNMPHIMNQCIADSDLLSQPIITTGQKAKPSRVNRNENFVCPFPGCGSIFTRSFYLKGTLCCLCCNETNNNLDLTIRAYPRA